MAIEARAGAMPLWIIINLVGELAGGAKMYTYSSLNKVETKPVYYDAGMQIPYTNPIQFGENGTSPTPFYFEYDSDNLDDAYYIEVYDSDDNLLWTLDNYLPGEGGGGGGSTNIPLNSLIANSVMLNHTDDKTSPLIEKDIFIAPSNHIGFTPNQINPVIGDHGVVGPDIWFSKNNLSATDSITFPEFARGNDPLIGDVTPNNYVRYQCTVAGTGETYKHFQFPIIHKVNNLDNQQLTATIWMRSVSGATGIEFYLRQYFGSPNGSPEIYDPPVGNKTLNGTWTKYVINMTVPNTAGKTLGDCGDDALYFCVGMPLSAACDIQFCKPDIFLGAIAPDETFSTYDQINAVIETPRTGQVKYMMGNYTPAGWLPMDGKTIGRDGSSATARANKDTFPLYKTLWDSISDAYAPVSTGRGGTAIEDFSSGKTLVLTSALGRMLMGMAPLDGINISFTATAADSQLAVADANIFTALQPIEIGSNTAGIPQSVYYVIPVDATHIKLAISVEAALAGTAISVTNGTGTINNGLGVQRGEGQHTLTIAEMPNHNHTLPPFRFQTVGGGTGAAGFFNSTPPFFPTDFVGGSQPHNNIPPYLGANIYIKL